jgi:hypothetical protein
MAQDLAFTLLRLRPVRRGQRANARAILAQSKSDSAKGAAPSIALLNTS